MERSRKKILILGSNTFAGKTESAEIHSVSWSELAQLKNFADYDLAVISLLSIADEAARDSVDWGAFQTLVTSTSARRICSHDGTIVVVGDPRFTIPISSAEKAKTPFLSWTGFNLTWDNSKGDTIEYDSAAQFRWFQPFQDHFKHWEYALASAEVDRHSFLAEQLTQFDRQEIRLKAEVTTGCRNRYRLPLVFSIRLIGIKHSATRLSFGPIHFVPRLQTNEEVQLSLVLRHLCQIEISAPEPPWLDSIRAPGQKPIDDQIEKTTAQIASLSAELSQAQERRKQIREWLGLLFEKELALEEIVRRVLCELGASIEEPVENNKEDGWITVTVGGQILEGVLEIKSTRNDTLNEAGRKQLTDWVDRGITQRGKKYKGIFIGNSAIAKPPAERPEPFGDGWKKALALSGYCALKTTDLYRAYEALRAGSFDHDQFWTSLFSTNGVLDIGQALGNGQDRPAT